MNLQIKNKTTEVEKLGSKPSKDPELYLRNIESSAKKLGFELKIND